MEAKAKTIQSLLGDHQDSVVSRTHLLEEADAAHAAGEDTFTYGVLYEKEAEVAHAAGEDTFTYGLLFQQEYDLAQRCEEQIEDALKKLDKSVG